MVEFMCDSTSLGDCCQVGIYWHERFTKDTCWEGLLPNGFELTLTRHKEALLSEDNAETMCFEQEHYDHSL